MFQGVELARVCQALPRVSRLVPSVCQPVAFLRKPFTVDRDEVTAVRKPCPAHDIHSCDALLGGRRAFALCRAPVRPRIHPAGRQAGPYQLGLGSLYGGLRPPHGGHPRRELRRVVAVLVGQAALLQIVFVPPLQPRFVPIRQPLPVVSQ
ncbi:MAG TPA: hypothetical protein VI011_26635 [Asanoa sp.]